MEQALEFLAYGELLEVTPRAGPAQALPPADERAKERKSPRCRSQPG